METTLPQSAAGPARQRTGERFGVSRSTAIALLLAVWAAVFLLSLFAPPLLDDADATHANAARFMAVSGDWVTLHVNGVRYLEKAPLPYWLVAVSFRIFGFNTFAAHLPQAIAVLLLALLGYRWGLSAFSQRTALYTGLGVLTSAGVFLFTRIFIPEVLLSLLLCVALYCLLRALAPDRNALTNYNDPDAPTLFRNHRLLHPYVMWAAVALAVLTKGLVALVFFFATAFLYLLFSGDWRHWRQLRPLTGVLLLLLIAAPWHVLAGLRNTGGANGHGFFWFYFINEHVLRFLGKRQPVDYNKLPWYLYWSLHLVWLFPWSLFLPLPLLNGLRAWRSRHQPPPSVTSYLDALYGELAGRTRLLLTLYTALVLLFFSLSTNQEYYTFPVYLPLLLLISTYLVRTENRFATDPVARRWVTVAHAAFTVIGAAAAVALAAGLWQSRRLPYVSDIGDLLAHRNVGDYTLSMSHFFDLTGPSFAALRLPAALAALALATGPAIAWLLRQQRRHFASTVAIALTSATFLVAAHVALVRFGPMLSSERTAVRIQTLTEQGQISAKDPVLLYGDQSYGSSIAFYLGRVLPLVNGRSSSMLFGSTFPDAPPIFLSSSDLLRMWNIGDRKLLFVPLEKRDEVEDLLRGHPVFTLQETSGKLLLTDRPLPGGSSFRPAPTATQDRLSP